MLKASEILLRVALVGTEWIKNFDQQLFGRIRLSWMPTVNSPLTISLSYFLMTFSADSSSLVSRT